MENDDNQYFDQLVYSKATEIDDDDYGRLPDRVPSQTWQMHFETDAIRIMSENDIVSEFVYADLKNPGIRQNYKQVCEMMTDLREMPFSAWQKKHLKN